MFLEFNQLIISQLLLRFVKRRMYMEVLERSEIVIGMPLLSVIKDQV